jgi:hypothetical protein
MKKLILALTLCLVMVALLATPAFAAKPVPYFSTRVTSDDARLPGTLNSHFIFNTEGIPNKWHTIGVTDTKTNLTLVDGDYDFYLVANQAQKDTLIAYFTAKVPEPYLSQLISEVNGDYAFMYLHVVNGVYSIGDGCMRGLGQGYIPLKIDDDYPVGKYVYTGDLGTESSPFPVTVTLKVMRWDTGFSLK